MARQLANAAYFAGEVRSHLVWPSLTKSQREKERIPSLCFPQVVLAHPRIARLSADVIQLPDIRFALL